MKMKNRDINFY